MSNPYVGPLEIKPNNAVTNDFCIACREQCCDPWGMDAFIPSTPDLVCEDCVDRLGYREQLDAARQQIETDDWLPVSLAASGGEIHEWSERRA